MVLYALRPGKSGSLAHIDVHLVTEANALHLQEVSYSKNWVFPGGSLIFDRWNTVLAKGYPMVEIITWNDYGESHYIGPLSSKHNDDGNSKWTNDM